MLVVDIYDLYELNKNPRVVCTLGWDEEKEEIVILKGKRIGEQILKERYLDKRYVPKQFRYLKAEQGKYFIRNLCCGLTGSYMWAGKARKR